MVSETKQVNAFSPDYVSQIEPFRFFPVYKPVTKQSLPPTSINTLTPSEKEAKRFKLLKASI